MNRDADTEAAVFMNNEIAGRWLAFIYNCRGQLGHEAWNAFADWCEREGLTGELPPGATLEQKLDYIMKGTL